MRRSARDMGVVKCAGVRDAREAFQRINGFGLAVIWNGINPDAKRIPDYQGKLDTMVLVWYI